MAFVAAVMLAGAIPAKADDSATKHLWAITRTPDGHERVVRGMAAATANMDVRMRRTSTAVVSYEQDHTVKTLGDWFRPDQWALDTVHFEDNWRRTNSGNHVVVAVVDTGVLAAHEDLVGNVLPGTDIASDAAKFDPDRSGRVDPGGHGTHVAGIIAAHANNGIGIAGAAPNALILPVRVLDQYGTGTASGVAEGIIWAADHNARIINLSLGGGPSAGMQTAIQYALSKNVLTFAAGGNGYQSGNSPSYPAAYPEAVAVASVSDVNGQIVHSPFSTTGSYIDLAAPGDYIVSTYGTSWNGYAWMSGTSMATPYAAAVAVLMLGQNPRLTASQIRSIMERKAHDLGAPGRDDTYGYGLIDVSASVDGANPLFIDGTQGNGYAIIMIDGVVHTFGNAQFHGDLTNNTTHAPILAGAMTPDGGGYWLVGSNGTVFPFGNAQRYAPVTAQKVVAPIVSISSSSDGKGYTLAGLDGAVYPYGDAQNFGSTKDLHVGAVIGDLARTADGGGYWLAAQNGNVYPFGDAQNAGASMRSVSLSKARSATPTSTGNGYWVVGEDGSIANVNAPAFLGLPFWRWVTGLPYIPSIRIRSLPTTDSGLYILASNGAVYGFGTAKNFGRVHGWAVDLMVAP